MYDPEDSESFYRLLSSKFLQLEPNDLIKISTTSRKKSTSIYEVFAENNPEHKLINLFNRHISEIRQKTAGEILYEYLVEMDIYKRIIEDEEDVKAKNISAFFHKVKSFENENPKALLPQVVDYINLLLEVGESPNVGSDGWQENDAVNILTVHSAKGLEFPVVFLVNLVSERFPGRNRSEDLPIPDELIREELPSGDFHTQEERRLFYVGMTRAKERLYLTSAKYYNDGKREKKISPFVAEAMGEITNNQNPISKQILNTNYQISKPVTHNIQTEKLKIEYLSVSQIETFKSCPLHYKLKYIYNLPTAKTASISFGISIHNTLKDLYESVKERGDIKEKELLEIYKNNWIEEGFENKKHKQEFFKKGEQYLIGILNNNFNKHIVPDKLEEKFTIKLFKDLKIGGTIDRIDLLDGGNLEIIDYKTGANIPSQKDVDKDLQLSVYAIAASEMYNLKPEQTKLSLYYLDNQEKISTTRTTEQLEKIKEEIYEYKKEIENSDFKCNNSYFCQQSCEFSMFCNKN